MLPTLALIEIRRRKKERNRKCARYLLKVTLSARAQFTLPAQFGKIKQSHSELVFLLSIALVSLFFSNFVFACIFSILHFVKHKEKTS